MQVRLPSPNAIKDPTIQSYFNQLNQALERAFEKLGELPRTKDRIVLTSVSASYTFNATTATLAEVRDAFATLVRDLQGSGEIS